MTVPDRSLMGGDALLDGWVLPARPHQTPAQDGTLVAHDVFHHHPQDRGTYREEIFSLGAQRCMEQATTTPARMRDDLQTAWFSVMANTLEQGSRGMMGLVLGPRPDDVDDLRRMSAADLHYWQDLYRDSIKELQLDFYDASERDAWEILLESTQVERAALAAWRGGVWAQQSFPDMEAARAGFSSVARAAGQGGRVGDTLVVSWDGAACRVERARAAVLGR